ncbi:MAG: flippase-like domain-containing protein [Bacteroidales bacterium]|nr:flippase-like domain-containing protein [Bacteroidales bacterium]
MKKNLFTAFKIAFFVGVGIFFIWLFMRNLTIQERHDIVRSFREANYFWIILSIFIGILSHISRTIRWKMLLEPMGYKPGFRNTFLAVFIGYFANLALPRLGEISRCGVLAKYENIPLQKAFGTVVTERGLDLLTFAAAFLINLVVHFGKLGLFRETSIYRSAVGKYREFEYPGLMAWLIIAIIASLAFLLFKSRRRIAHTYVYRKFRDIILGFIEGLKTLLNVRRPLLFIFHSLFIWLMYLLMTWVVFFCLPETANLGLDVGLAVFVFGTIGIMVIQGGIGIYPWIVAESLAIFGIMETKGYAVGWLLWSGQTITIILAGIISLMLLPVVNQPQNGKAGIGKVQDTIR